MMWYAQAAVLYLFWDGFTAGAPAAVVRPDVVFTLPARSNNYTLPARNNNATGPDR